MTDPTLYDWLALVPWLIMALALAVLVGWVIWTDTHERRRSRRPSRGGEEPG